MVKMAKKCKLLRSGDRQLGLDNYKKTVVYQKGEAVFAFNFHPWKSYDGCFLPMPESGDYEVVMSTDDHCFGGHGRIYHQTYTTTEENGWTGIRLYLPSRTAVVLRKK
jgi:1,4-alpha-glucan branching enzyme